MTKHKKYYTTGEISRYCEVDINTVKNWIKAGDLKGFKTPSGHFRVYRLDFISFITHQGFTYDSDFFGRDPNAPDILVVDNDPKHKEIIVNLLKKLYPNMIIRLANNGIDGYFIMRELNPRLVIINLVKPLMSGLEFIKTMRANQKLDGIGLAVISAQLDKTTLYEIQKLKVDEYFEKPVNEEKFKNVCDLFLNGT